MLAVPAELIPPLAPNIEEPAILVLVLLLLPPPKGVGVAVAAVAGFPNKEFIVPLWPATATALPPPPPPPNKPIPALSAGAVVTV